MKASKRLPFLLMTESTVDYRRTNNAPPEKLVPSDISDELELLNEFYPEEAILALANITRKTVFVNHNDVAKISDIFGMFTEDIMPFNMSTENAFGLQINIQICADILSNVANYEEHVLSAAQLKQKATDRLLASYVRIIKLLTYENSFSGHKLIISQNIVTLVIRVSKELKSNVRGLTAQLLNNELVFKPLQSFVELQDIVTLEHLQLAVYIPGELVEEISIHLPSVRSYDMSITIFMVNKLFQNENRTVKTVSYEVGVILPIDYINAFENSFIVIYKNFDDKYLMNMCASWKYGYDYIEGDIHGRWDNFSQANDSLGNNLYICNYQQSAYFGLVGFGEKNGSSLNVYGRYKLVLFYLMSYEVLLMWYL